MKITNRDQFLALFDSAAQAVEFENQCLSAGRKFLPSAAQAVLAGEPATTAYWQWLAEQWLAEWLAEQAAETA